MVKDLLKFGLGVSYIIIATIALFGILNMVTIWFFTRSMLRGLLNRVNQLDSTLAEAIQTVVGNGLGEVEPVNPVQLMLMELFKQHMQPKTPNLELLKDDKGKFI
tara:strand:+ start:191 stop:505 length:315 start_codon:yes stop_codon:yes gene_type:complete